jgi:hypothetical protein
MRSRLRDRLSRHPRLAVGGAVGVVVLVGVAVELAIGVFGARPTADASADPQRIGQPVCRTKLDTAGTEHIPTARLPLVAGQRRWAADAGNGQHQRGNRAQP